MSADHQLDSLNEHKDAHAKINDAGSLVTEQSIE